MKKIAEKFILILIALLLTAVVILVGSQGANAQKAVRFGSGYNVSFSDISGYNRIIWTTYSGEKNDYFTDLQRMEVSRETVIYVDHMALFWLLGQDTLSVQVIAPPFRSGPPIVCVNGKNLATGTQVHAEHWKYEFIVPLIEEFYANGN